ncbi:MAG: hypothetical protein D8G53_06905 [Candidatus Saccharimonas sp.]|nr:MAG: hypothetical protein D8G53_06905 [Candidatus Saccharimonas sp.]
MSRANTIDGSYLYMTFRGPSVDAGEMDIGQASRVFAALDKWKKQYEKEFAPDNNFSIKLKSVEKGCTDFHFIVEALKAGWLPMTIFATSKLANAPGVKDFLQEIGKEFGKQVALKIASKGKTLTESAPYIENNKVMVDVFSGKNKIGSMEKRSTDFYRKSNKSLNDLYVLEANKITEAEVGYKIQGSDRCSLATIKLTNRESFIEDNPKDKLADRLLEPFDERKAEEVRIVGRFIDSYGLAQKYQFALQVREDVGMYGKQKVLCEMPAELISPTYDLLKPENRKNVTVKGLATRDNENRLDKMKVEWYSNNPDHNPDQTDMMNYLGGDA